MTTNTSSPPVVEPRDLSAELEMALAPLQAALSGLEPKDVPLPEVTKVWQLFSQIRRLAGNGSTLLASRVAEATEWRNSGHPTVEEWMAAKAGTSIGAAKGEVETSGRLSDGLDETSDRMRTGAISSEQGGIIADAAAVNPAAEADLCDRAEREANNENLRREARRRKAQRPTGEDRAQRHHRERRARRYVDADDKSHLHVEGPSARLAAFFAAWERETDCQFRAAQRAGRREGLDAYRFDAFLAVVGRGLDPAAAPSTPATRAKHLAMIRVDLSALVRGAVDDGEVCEIAGVGTIPVSEARELLGDSILKLVCENGVDVQNITHLGRGPNAVQALAILWADQTCQVLGCSRTHTQFDHRVDFRTTRHTRVDETDLLCDPHHDDKTYRGWALVVGKGRRPFVPPDDPRHPNHSSPPATGPPDTAPTGTAPTGTAPTDTGPPLAVPHVQAHPRPQGQDDLFGTAE